jgi:hypothetical protein
MGAVGRSQRRTIAALEIVAQDELAVVLGQDQVEPRSREVGVEQKLRVGNDNGVRRRMARNRIDMDVRTRRPALAIGEERGVKFARVI